MLLVLAVTVLPVTLAQRLTRDTGIIRGAAINPNPARSGA